MVWCDEEYGQGYQVCFLTGVTKFGKVSVFSDLNNLMDISMDDRNANICGITEPEIHAYFKDDLHELARVQNMDYDQVCIALREFYDGYHFTENLKGIYNPFGLLNTFKYLQFGSYWFETGTPTYLVKLLKHSHYNLYNMAYTEMDADVLNSIDSTSVNPIPVIYQSGYLLSRFRSLFVRYVPAIMIPFSVVCKVFLLILLTNWFVI